MDFESDFTPSGSLIYLNSGSLSRTPLAVMEAVLHEIRHAEVNPTRHLFSAWERIWKSQQSLARMLGARPEDLFLRSNVSQAMNEFLLGVPLKKGGEILISDLEYGAIVNICRRRAELNEQTVREFELPLRPEEVKSASPESILRLITDQLRPETRLLMLSHVMTGNGLTLPIKKIAKACRERGVVFAVDGAQAPGALPLDFAQLDDLDFYGGNVHKWLMGPKGTGFGWVHPRWQEQLFPAHIGWTSYESAGPFASFAPSSRFASRLLTSSTLEFAPFFALPALEEFWLRHQAALHQRLLVLQDLTFRLAQELGWPLLSPTHPELRGPLFALDMVDELAQEGLGLMSRLEKDYSLVVSTPRVKGRHRMRISPHVYNTPAEIKRGFQILSSLRSRE